MPAAARGVRGERGAGAGARLRVGRLRDRRRIRTFFFQEVDRDKLVLAGADPEGADYR